MMSFTDFPVFRWRNALLSVIHFLNWVLSKFVPTILYELWHGKSSTLGYLKIRRCLIYVKQQQVDKLEARSFKARFIGYPKETMEYCFYLSEDHNVIVSHHIIFLEKEFIQDGDNGRKIELEEKSLKSVKSKNLNLIMSQ